MPWNIVEGLVWETSGEWMVGDGDDGLWDTSYSCQRCHMLGTTMKGAPGKSVPNPAASIEATPETAVQWARDESTTVQDFMKDPTVSYAGLGIQCEQCHGTGAGRHGARSRHDRRRRLQRPRGPGSVPGLRPVPRQLHQPGQHARHLRLHHQPPDARLRRHQRGERRPVVHQDPERRRIPLSPTAYYMFPNGSNASGNHYYYNEWAASGHSYRGALTAEDPDAMAFQAAGNGHFNASDAGISAAPSATPARTTCSSKGDQIARTSRRPRTTSARWARSASPATTGIRPRSAPKTSSASPTRPASAAPRASPSTTPSICEDCHNWQYEVLGTSPTTSRRPTSHPRRREPPAEGDPARLAS